MLPWVVFLAWERSGRTITEVRWVAAAPSAVVVDQGVVPGRLEALGDRAVERFFEQEKLVVRVSGENDERVEKSLHLVPARRLEHCGCVFDTDRLEVLPRRRFGIQLVLMTFLRLLLLCD